MTDDKLIEAECKIADALALARMKRQFPDMADMMTDSILPSGRDIEDAQTAPTAHAEWMKAEGLVYAKAQTVNHDALAELIAMDADLIAAAKGEA